MNRFNHSARAAYGISLLLLALLSVSVVYGQDSTPSILYAVRDEKSDKTNIYALNVDGNTKTQVGTIHNFGSDAGWSPDGKTIYLLDWGGMGQRTITLIDVETNHRQTISDQLGGDACSLPFWWSPDGKSLAYAAKSGSQALLKILNTTTGDIQSIANVDLVTLNISWSHDGRYLTFPTTFSTGTYDFAIWDAQTEQIVSTMKIASYEAFPQWSPTANRIAYGSSDSSHNIVYDLIDGTQQPYMADRIGRWSPDGRFLTIFNKDSEGRDLISIIDVIAHTKLELDADISTADIDSDAAWSFDSRFLALATVDSANRYKSTFYVVDMTNQSSRRLIGTPLYYDNFAWSPVDNLLGFATYPESDDDDTPYTTAWVFDIDTQKQQHFDVEIAPYYFQPALNWSPDGRYMTIRTTTGTSLFDKELGQLTSITRSPYEIAPLLSSPDGSQIALYFYTSNADYHDIYVFTPESGTLKNITNTPDESENFLGWQGTQQNRNLIFCGEG